MNLTDFHILTIQIFSEDYLDGKIDLKKYIKELEERLKFIKERAGN